MKHCNQIFLCLLLWLITLSSYSQRSYREKYASVITHYANDSLKQKAALFLIDNMEGHVSPEGKQIELFQDAVASIRHKEGIKALGQEWLTAGKNGAIRFVPDSVVVTDRMLMSNIDAAFDAWLSAPWGTNVDYYTFCNYILPYRCSNEHIGGNWRKAMREKYSHLVIGETNIQKAFAKIKKAVFTDVVLSNSYCPYELDAITTYNTGKAECGQRAVLLTDVLRALGIPAAIDITPMWADYSNKGHGWVSVIANDGTTSTVFENDSIARSMNPIDASVFTPRYKVKSEDHCPYAVKKTKTPVKIYRKEYSMGAERNHYSKDFFASNHLKDVSSSYGLNAKIELDANNGMYVYLCSYLSSQDWVAIDCTVSRNGKAVFSNVGKNSVCTAYVMENGRRRYITKPFIVKDEGIARYFQTDTINRERIEINRKYPLCQYTVDTWGYMKRAIFLGANKSDFSDADTLATIMTVPYGLTEIECGQKGRYRYLRYQAPKNNRSSLSDLEFIAFSDGTKKTLKGSYSCEGVDTIHLEYLTDDNTATSCRGLIPGYEITLDLGEKNESEVNTIKFAPSTDLNFVEKGHLYELYYFDTSWVLLDRQIAHEEKLIFDGVPNGALLLLKDRTKGQEERIFEFKDGRQLWH